MIKTDLKPHFLTHVPHDTTPTTIRTTLLTVGTRQQRHAHASQHHIPPHVSPHTLSPLLILVGLISLPHDLSRHNTNLITLPDHIHTCLIPTQLHSAITSHTAAVCALVPTNSRSPTILTTHFTTTSHALLATVWIAYHLRHPNTTFKNFLNHLCRRLQVDLTWRFTALQRIHATLLTTLHASCKKIA